MVTDRLAVAVSSLEMFADAEAIGFPVALKTGTTRGYTDNLAFGTTREDSAYGPVRHPLDPSRMAGAPLRDYWLQYDGVTRLNATARGVSFDGEPIGSEEQLLARLGSDKE